MRAPGHAKLWAGFIRGVLERDRTCRMAHGYSPCDGHLTCAHVVPKQRLKRAGFGADVIYSPSAAMTLCTRHHNRHDRWLERIRFEDVPALCVEFYNDLGISLEREFPAVAA